MPTTIAIMQPYFIPYTGYFRLIAGSDLFVVYDCVQFPRRGWVHRNKLLDARGEEQWLTMPLAKAPQDVLIKDLAFPPNAASEIEERLRAFPAIAAHAAELVPLIARLRRPETLPVDYILGLLESVCAYLGVRWNVVRSSTLDVPESFRGQDRIIEIARRVGGERYLNAPGGRDLYDHAAFRDAGLELTFLPAYAGAPGSILQRLLTDARETIRADITDWTPQA